MKTKARGFTALVAYMMVVSAPAQSAGGFESTPKLAGADLAPAALLGGPLHSVGEPVAIEHYMGRFNIESKLGEFRVLGVHMLGTRVQELAAIVALDEVNRSEAFQQALVRSAQAPVQLIGSAFTNPVGTVENIASGFGTILGRVGRLATTGAQAVGDTASDMSSNRQQTQTSAPFAGEAEPPAFTGDPFGFNKARREWAKQLQIDPYTTNPVLRPRLDAVARATFVGDFAVNATIGLVVAPLQYASSFDSVVRDSVWNTPVIDLVARNERKLQMMGITGRPVRDFFRNRWFTPTLQTALVEALDKLPDVRGRETVIVSAATLGGEVRARALIGAVLMLVRQHRETPLRSIKTSGVIVVGSPDPGELIVAADLDYVWWNEQTAEFTSRSDLKAKRRTLLVSGTVSERTVRELAHARWAVRSGLRAETKN
ncbi:MAG: hypothetical protein IT521_04560 [Burkholderiales bacterium]|nr:hypothetical protein [Burkholderiales bacterium]